MKPAPLDHAAPASVAEAVALLGDSSREAVVLAGGQSLVPMLNLRLARPDVLVDLGRIEGLDYIREVGDHLAIGAMTTKRAVERSAAVRSRQPMLAEATLQIGHPQIRNRGTVGGSMVQADPAAEYPAVALATGAEMTAVGPEGERSIAADDFFLGYLTTALRPSELLTEVRVPVLAPGRGWGFVEVSRRHGDFAMAGAAVSLGLGRRGRCSDVRIVTFAVAPRPMRMRAAEEIVEGAAPDDELFARAAEAVSQAIDDPTSDVQASADYRRHLAGTTVRRGLAQATARAAGREVPHHGR